MLVAALAGLLSACGGGSGSSASAKPDSLAESVTRLEVQGQLPRQVSGDSVAGVDSDGNGVRDDLDAFLAAQSYGAQQTQAATQLAAPLRSALMLGPSDMAEARAVSFAMSRAVACVYHRFTANSGDQSPQEVVALVERASINTRARFEAYVAFNSMLANSVISLEDAGSNCD
jgi:hypothetical protein